MDAGGNPFIVDIHCVRRVDDSGAVATVAGTGRTASSGDGGPALQASLKSPNWMALDPDGNLFIGTD